MKVLYLLSAIICLTTCSGRQATDNHAIIGSADTATTITATDGNPEHDPNIHEIPQCRLWYTAVLPTQLDTDTVHMSTDQLIYSEDTDTINVLVANPTTTPLAFGRSWFLHCWDGTRWSVPERRITGFSWEDDLFSTGTAPALLCFRIEIGKYYRLTKGKYRLTKKFYQNGKEITLSADFNIK